MTKRILKYSILGFAAMLLTTGCSYKGATTPAVMTYDGSSVDYSKVTSMKSAKVCKAFFGGDGDTTTIAAAKEAGISKIKHVDTSFEYKQFLIFQFDHQTCTTVYGE